MYEGETRRDLLIIRCEKNKGIKHFKNATQEQEEASYKMLTILTMKRRIKFLMNYLNSQDEGQKPLMLCSRAVGAGVGVKGSDVTLQPLHSRSPQPPPHRPLSTLSPAAVSLSTESLT